MCIVPSLAATAVLAEGEGILQTRFMDFSQGDGAVVISPRGEVILFDDGLRSSHVELDPDLRAP